MKNIKCIVYPQKKLNSIKEDFETFLKISDIQSYYPLMTLFMEFYNESDTNFVFNSNFILTKIIEKLNIKNDDTYIKHFFKTEITNQFTQEKYEKDIFIKIMPILNVLKYMMNTYKLESSGLPNIHNFITSKKINDINNMAYIDVFFSFLGSKLTEEGKCPTFPLFYGSFTGRAEEFLYDISEEYSSMKHESWYKFNFKKLFDIKTIELEETHFSSLKKNKLNVKSLKESDLNLLNIDTLLDNDDCFDNKIIELSDSENQINEIDGEKNESDGSDVIDLEKNENVNDNIDDHGSDDHGSDDDGSDDHGSDDDGSDDDGSDDDGSDDDGSDGEKNESEASDNDGSDWTDIDSSFSINSDSLCNENYEVNYAVLKNIPVQINCIEKLSKTLDNYIEETNNCIEDNEWLSIIFQICFGLSVAQKNFNFVHNDLHSSNIMFKETNLEFMYFQFYDTYFKIPTYKKITKIIDFGRAIFNYKSKLFFSDVFKKDGDAEGQYSYPYSNSLKNCKIKPNYSFDLSRLATTIIEHFDDEDNEIYKLLKLWCMDKYGNFLVEQEDSFDLYRIIAKNVISAVPKKQLSKKIFRKFIVKKDDIGPDEFIYKY